MDSCKWFVARYGHEARPLHEPTHPRPLPGGEQTFVRAATVPLLGGVRGGFMVPMHARKRKEAFHEPQRRAGILPAFVGNADRTEPLALARSPEQAGSLPYVERDPSIPAVFDLFPVGGELEFRAVVWIVAAQTVHLSEVE